MKPTHRTSIGWPLLLALRSIARGSSSTGRAAASKAAGSGFESSLPRLIPAIRRPWSGIISRVGVAAYILFLLAGVGFGYAASARWKWLPFLFPIALALGAIVNYGLDAVILIRLIVALAITAAGILVGALLDQRTGRSEQATHA